MTTAPKQRWLRIIPIAVVMYTIVYVDRTNVALALEPKISSMMKDLFMDDRMKGEAMGIFFFGYAMLQMAGGKWASRWGGRRVVSLFLIAWGICAAGCGLARTFRQFEVMRFLLGVAESGVFPAASVLMANWFPRSERARATAYWLTCQPLAVAATSPITSRWLAKFGWQWTLVVEGILPLLWLPVWWFGIRDEPRQAKWVSAEEREFLEKTINAERAHLEPAVKIPLFKRLGEPVILTMVVLYFLHNSALFGCMTFFTTGLKSRGFSALEYGILFSIPYTLAVIAMVINSRHSDKVHERRAHIGLPYLASGILLILSVVFSANFWASYVLLCLAIPGPFAAMPVFWAVPAESFPRGMMGQVIGLVNALGNLGGLAGPYFVGWLTDKYHSTGVPFVLLGVGTMVSAGLAFMLPRSAKMEEILAEKIPDVSAGQAEIS